VQCSWIVSVAAVSTEEGGFRFILHQASTKLEALTVEPEAPILCALPLCLYGIVYHLATSVVV